jgi:hypothetical protein
LRRLLYLTLIALTLLAAGVRDPRVDEGSSGPSLRLSRSEFPGRQATARYCVNRRAQPSGDHEVHRSDCRYWPAPGNRLDLGEHANCHEALAEAQRHYRQVDGCYYCSPDCNTD